MARLLQLLVEPPRPCSYLADHIASLEHRVLVDTTPAEVEALLQRGWRRFGPDTFRPACPACSLCIPMRVVVSAFRPSKSERRAVRASAALRVEIGAPRVDAERLALHRAWHAFREDERGWPAQTLSRSDYALSFAFPHPSARELAYYDDDAGGRLVGVAICDETPNAWSAVYFFYDPAYARRSMGVANVVRQIELARERGHAHVYLGYWVPGSTSMAYKARFGPAEHLVGWPGDHEAPAWRLAGSATDAQCGDP